MKRTLLKLVCIALLASLVACGGGGGSTGGNDPADTTGGNTGGDTGGTGGNDTGGNTGGDNTPTISNATLTGSYSVAEWANETNIGGSAWTARGTLTSTGNGSSSYQVTQISSGSTGTLNFPYSINSQGLFNIGTGGASSTGQISSDGRYFFVADTDKADQDVIFRFGVKTGSGLSNATLSGDYVLYEMGDFNGAPWTARMSMTANGGGAGTYTVLADSDGGSGTASLAYSVTADGTLTLDDMPGHISADGSVFLLTDANAADGSIKIMIGVKKSNGKTNADFNGAYHIAEIGIESGTPWATRMSFVANGSGSGTYTILADSDGGSGTATSTYSVNADGTFTLDGMSGILSADGKVMVLIDTNPGDNVLKIMLGIK